ncbi:MAG: zinc ribbon domain-containing protein [bacterium]
MSEANDLIPCPICGEPIRAVAKKCRFCGEDLVANAKRQEVSEEKLVYKGEIPVFYSVGQIILLIFLLLLFVIPGLVYLICRWYESASNRFTITTQRLGIETGWLSKGGENIELFRIDDFGINSPIGMKLMGWSLLIFRSSDRTGGAVQVLVPVERQTEIATTVRQAIFDQREFRKILTHARS